MVFAVGMHMIASSAESHGLTLKGISSITDPCEDSGGLCVRPLTVHITQRCLV